MSLSYGILGFLNYSPMTGYELAKVFKDSINFFWHAQNSHIYLELKKLEKNGLIQGETVIQIGKPNKKVFSITDKGKKVFIEWIINNSKDETAETKSAFLIKVFFSGNVSPKQSIKMLKKYKQDLLNYAKGMETIPNNIDMYSHALDSYQTLYWQFTVDYGNALIKTNIDWAERCIKKLEELL